MKKNNLAICFSILAFVDPSVGFTADSCNALLTVGIYNVAQSSNANEGESLAKSTFCSADYSLNSTTSSVQASIKGAYGLFSGGASGAVTDSQIIETQRNVCTYGFNSSAYSSEASSYSRNIYQGALDAWNQCNTLASKGLNFEIQTDNTMQGVTVSLSTASTGTTSKFLGLSQTGLGTSVCKTTTTTGELVTLAENTLFTLSSAKKLTVVCKRKMKNDGNGNLFSDAQSLIFNTTTGAYQVPLSGIGSLARSTLDQVKAEIRVAVNNDTQTFLANETQNLIKATNDSINATKTELKNSIDKVNTRINGISLNIVRNPNVYDIATLTGERDCDNSQIVYGFRNSPASSASLDMWRCASLSLTIPQ
ncbi:hypothetical protein JCM14076_24150 [Methylosoma difficile]